MNKILFIILPLVLFSCKSKTDNIRFGALSQSIANSNELISAANKRIYNEMEEKLHDPVTKAKAEVWQPKAVEVGKLCKKLYSFVDSLTTSTQNYPNETDQLFKDRKMGDDLYNKLAKFKQSIIAVIQPVEFNDNPMLQKNLIRFIGEIQNTTLKDVIDSTSKSNLPPAAFRKYFEQVSAERAVVMLRKIKGDILLAENTMLNFCNRMTNSLTHEYMTFKEILTTNTSALRQGELLRVYAGIGSFSTASNPSFTINGVDVPIGNDGHSVFELKITSPPGNYAIPVKTVFTKPDGSRYSSVDYVKYKVLK